MTPQPTEKDILSCQIQAAQQMINELLQANINLRTNILFLQKNMQETVEDLSKQLAEAKSCQVPQGTSE